MVTMLECFDILGEDSQLKIRKILEDKIVSEIENADFSKIVEKVVSAELGTRIEYWIDDIDSTEITKKLADKFLRSF